MARNLCIAHTKELRRLHNHLLSHSQTLQRALLAGWKLKKYIGTIKSMQLRRALSKSCKEQIMLYIPLTPQELILDWFHLVEAFQKTLPLHKVRIRKVQRQTSRRLLYLSSQGNALSHQLYLLSMRLLFKERPHHEQPFQTPLPPLPIIEETPVPALSGLLELLASLVVNIRSGKFDFHRHVAHDTNSSSPPFVLLRRMAWIDGRGYKNTI